FEAADPMSENVPALGAAVSNPAVCPVKPMGAEARACLPGALLYRLARGRQGTGRRPPWPSPRHHRDLVEPTAPHREEEKGRQPRLVGSEPVGEARPPEPRL